MRIMLHQPLTPEAATETSAPSIPTLAHGWTPAIKAKFLDHLATKGNARASCAHVGLSPEAAYRLRRRDGDFARGWAAALVLARESSVQVLADRAIDGIEERIFYRGELIDIRRKYDTRLLLAHIARLDRLVDEAGAGEDAARFDELLARIAGEESPSVYPEEDPLMPCDRRTLADFAADQAMDAVTEAWVESSGSKLSRLSAARDAEYQAEREAAAERARAGARVQWDEWIARACGTVDALVEGPAASPLPGLPANPPPPPIPAETLAAAAGESSPRTPSTVSTAALALSLSKGAPAGFVTPPTPCSGAADRTH